LERRLEQATLNNMKEQSGNLLKSIIQNIGVVLVGLGLAYLSTKLDSLLHLPNFYSSLINIVGWIFIILGFLLRVWATFYFYKARMRVISLVPQRQLIVEGPYRFSRNPLYLGGNVFIFFGAAFIFGSPTGLLLTAIHLPLMDLFIRREEKQLERDFGEEWKAYKKQVRRWL
jgi:protein-S-isoprenylcysteine O-methyltransferase Ste14